MKKVNRRTLISYQKVFKVRFVGLVQRFRRTLGDYQKGIEGSSDK